MKVLSQDQLTGLFPPLEGELHMIYGRIGSGKTYTSTVKIIEYLRMGVSVYSSYPVDWQGYDERLDKWVLFKSFFSFNNRFYSFPKENFHYFSVYKPETWVIRGEKFDNIWDFLDKLTDCVIFFDDVIVELFDSYEKTFFSKKKRQWAFQTRHFDRTIVLVTQRPTQVQIALRSQVNRFFKCAKEKIWWFPFIDFFVLREYQDMISENVDETQDPVSVSVYRPKLSIFKAYQTKYLRAGAPSSQDLVFDGFILSLWEKFLAFCSHKPLKRFMGTGRKPAIEIPF